MISVLSLLLIQLNMLVLYAFYRFVLSTNRNFGLNRAFLVLIPLLSVVIAFVEIPQFSQPTEWIMNSELDELVIGTNGIVAFDTSEVTFMSVLSEVLILGAWIWLLSLFIKLTFLGLKILRSKKEKQDGFILLLSDLGHESFSFFNWVYLPSTLNADEKAMILAHELEHVRLKHSFDLFLVEFFQCVFWFNPVYSFLKRKLKAVHEFQADLLPAEQGQLKYSRLILAQSLNTKSKNLVHTFHESSLTKNRIMMLKNKKAKTVWQYVLILPILTGLLYLSSCTKNEESNQDVLSNTEKSAVITDFDELKSKPQFPGGKKELFAYLSENIKYPKELSKEGAEGRVYISFVIDTEGRVTEPSILKTEDERLNKAALAVLEDMPAWVPAQDKQGKHVSTKFTLPIMFKLEGE